MLLKWMSLEAMHDTHTHVMCATTHSKNVHDNTDELVILENMILKNIIALLTCFIGNHGSYGFIFICCMEACILLV